MVSDNILKANKENAKLGGVKTSVGKEVSKYNALTYGILRMSVTDYESEFYPPLLDDLIKEYKPKTIIEQILIERIALYYLKLLRIQKAETEYIKSQLDPRKIQSVGGININLDDVIGKKIITNEGYVAQITEYDIEQLTNIYCRYETNIENKLLRVIHELERFQRIRKGEKVQSPIVADINQTGSFSKNGIL
jgi:hypothetical protein